MTDSRFLRASCGLTIALLLSIPDARGQGGNTSRFGDITVTSLTGAETTRSHGYVEHRFLIKNDSADAHEVTISLPNRSYRDRETHLESVSRTARVEGGSSVTLKLLIPSFPPIYGSGVRVDIDGEEQDKYLGADFTGGVSHAAWHGMPVENAVMVSRELQHPLIQVAEGERQGGFPGPLSATEFLPTRGAVNEWSRDWLAYSSYDAIILTENDYRTMPAEVRAAILHATEVGGVLVLLGQVTVPASWTSAAEPIPGLGNLKLFDAGFGRGIVIESTDINDLWARRYGSTLSAQWSQTKQPWENMLSVNEAARKFPIVEDMSIPVKALFVIMILFILVIGPLNITILSRMKQRIQLLWTVPAISAVTCVAVFGFMLLLEGWDGHLRTESLTYLDQRSKRASTVGWTGFYSPIVPGDGLHFSRSTEVMLQEASPYSRHYGPGYGRQAGGNKACHLDWTNEQNLKQGWLAARVPSHFQVRKSESRNERLNIFRDGGSLKATNLLGAPIANLKVMDEEGRLYRAESIQAGAQVTLSPMPEEPTTQSLRSFFTQDWLFNLNGFKGQGQRYLRPGSYLAELEESPFLEDGLRDAQERKYHCWVLGIYEPKQ